MISSFASYLLASFPLWMSRVLDLITAFILCIYFMLEGEFAYYYFLSFFTDGPRERLAKTLVVAEHRMSKWLLGQGSLMLILGVCSTIVFAILHVRYFFLLGVLMGLFNIIPVMGGVITILLAAGCAALDSWSKMAGVLIFYAVYVQVENGFLTPKNHEIQREFDGAFRADRPDGRAGAGGSSRRAGCRADGSAGGRFDG
jgi:predicted PurR-regulated permease PerM